MALRNGLSHSGASFFSLYIASAVENHMNATVFTRIHTLETPEAVRDALNSAPQLQYTFIHGHLSEVLIFDNDREQHLGHIKAVLDMLRAKDMKTDHNCCAFIKPSSSEAGFHIEPIGEGQLAFMITLREDMPHEN